MDIYLTFLQILLYYNFGKKQVGKLHKHLQQKLLKMGIDTKFRRAGPIARRRLYHICLNLSIGKNAQKISPQNRGEIFVKLHK